MRRLLPGVPSDRAGDVSSEVTVDEAYAAPLGRHDNRPWVGLCMVASIDGSTVVDGASAQLSSVNDAAVLWRLRELADVLIVGAGTVRDEGYGPPKKAGQRIGVVTASGSVDVTRPLFTSGAGFLITPNNATVPTGIDAVQAGSDRVDLTQALTRLGEVCDRPAFVQCEGGAGLNGALFDQDVVDEINVTTSPLTVGGTGLRLAVGGDGHAHRFGLAQLTIDDESFVYARWVRQGR
jgi:riboflavin biosynthesis pyrimidine reductase